MSNSTFSQKQEMTMREAQVVELLAEGLSDKEIAERLGTSTNTVVNHLRHVKERLGVQKSTEVVLAYICRLHHLPFDLRRIRALGLASYLGI
jgi:DNA-binding CsgD family transcriptional regulator